jgi:hypothetical protein
MPVAATIPLPAVNCLPPWPSKLQSFLSLHDATRQQHCVITASADINSAACSGCTSEMVCLQHQQDCLLASSLHTQHLLLRHATAAAPAARLLCFQDNLHKPVRCCFSVTTSRQPAGTRLLPLGPVLPRLPPAHTAAQAFQLFCLPSTCWCTVRCCLGPWQFRCCRQLMLLLLLRLSACSVSHQPAGTPSAATLDHGSSAAAASSCCFCFCCSGFPPVLLAANLLVHHLLLPSPMPLLPLPQAQAAFASAQAFRLFFLPPTCWKPSAAALGHGTSAAAASSHCCCCSGFPPVLLAPDLLEAVRCCLGGRRCCHCCSRRCGLGCMAAVGSDHRSSAASVWTNAWVGRARYRSLGDGSDQG